MTDSVERTLTLAKSGKLSRSELYAKMQILAEGRREPGQSPAQAFAKLIGTPEGLELYQIQKSLPGQDIELNRQATVAKSSPSTDLWDGLVRGVMRSEKCNYSTAVNKCLATEEGRTVFNDVRRAERIASGFSYADMECQDRIDAQQDGYRDMHKRHTRSKFEEMTEDLMSKRGLSRSKAMDYLRTTPDGLAAWQEFKSKPGAVHLPQS